MYFTSLRQILGVTCPCLAHTISVHQVDQGCQGNNTCIPTPAILNRTPMSIGQYSLNTPLPCPSSEVTQRQALHCLSSTAGLHAAAHRVICSITHAWLTSFPSYLTSQGSLWSLPIKEISQGLFVRILYLSGFYREKELMGFVTKVQIPRSAGWVCKLETQKSWWLSSSLSLKAWETRRDDVIVPVWKSAGSRPRCFSLIDQY